MKKKVPNRILRSVIEEIVRENGTVNSLSRLVNLSKNKLDGSGYTVSYGAIRSQIFRIGEIEVSVRYRKGNVKSVSKKCPVCGNGLKEVKNRTLTGENAVTFYYCLNCGFRSEDGGVMPMRYLFKYRSH